MDAKIETSRRAAIVQRLDGLTSTVKASAIQDGSELAYAMRFLTDHFVYKRSKGGSSINQGAAAEARAALLVALEGLETEVMSDEPKAPKVPEVSPLVDGRIANPWENVGA